MGMNLCIFEGVICGGNAAPKYYPPDGQKKSFITFSIAITSSRKNTNGQYEADFVSCKSFNSTADFINSHFKEKDHIGVHGSYILEKSTNQQGQETSYPKFIIEKAYFVGANTNANNSANSQTPQYGAPQPMQQQYAPPPQQQQQQQGYAPVFNQQPQFAVLPGFGAQAQNQYAPSQPSAYAPQQPQQPQQGMSQPRSPVQFSQTGNGLPDTAGFVLPY